MAQSDVTVVSFSDVVESFAGTVVSNLRAHYTLGQRLHAIRYMSATEGEQAPLQAVADQLQLDVSVLRRYARVAETIGPSEFEHIVSLRTSRGLPVTWSHIERLAMVRNASNRKNLAEEAAATGLSVRALAAKIRASW